MPHYATTDPFWLKLARHIAWTNLETIHVMLKGRVVFSTHALRGRFVKQHSGSVFFRIVKHFSEETLIRRVSSGLWSPTWSKSNLLRKTQLPQILRFLLFSRPSKENEIRYYNQITEQLCNSYVPNICKISSLSNISSTYKNRNLFKITLHAWKAILIIAIWTVLNIYTSFFPELYP